MDGPLWEREAEQASITAALDRAWNGRGTALFFRGDPGLGKTRLLAAGAALAGGRLKVVHSRGHEMEQAYPFGVVHQMVEFLPRVYGIKTEELVDGLEPVRLLLRGSVTEAGAGAAPGRVELVYALYWLLASLAERQPLLLCLDDLHWCDPDSLEVIRFLVARLERLPLAVIGGLRPWPSVAAGMAERLALEGRGRVWDLRPLSREAAGRFVAHRTGWEPETERVEEAHRLTGGNPFLLEELARMWRNGGRPSRELESGAGSLALARLTGLPADSLRLLEMASVLGSEFPLAVALEMAEVAGSQEEAVMVPLFDLGLLVEEGGQAAFLHPLLRQAVYEGMPHGRRLALHRRAAGLLRARGARAVELAPHLVLAASPGDLAAARELWIAAAEAGALGAHEAAAAHLRCAADLIPPGPERGRTLCELGRAYQRAGEQDKACVAFAATIRSEGCEGGLAAAVHLAWSFSLTLVGDTAAARQHMDSAMAAAGEDLSLAAQAAIAKVVLEMTTRGMRQARVAAGKAMKLAGNSGDAAVRARAMAAWANVAFQFGDPGAYGLAREACAALPDMPVDEVELLWGWSPRVALGMIAMRSERYAEAEELFLANREAAGARRANYALVWVSTFLAELEWRRGRLRDAFRYSDDATLYPVGIPWVTALAHAVRGGILLDMGDWEGAAACLVRSETECREAALGPARLWCGWIKASLAVRQGDAVRAAEILLDEGEEADRLGILASGFVPWLPEAAETCVRAGRLPEAEGLVEKLRAAADTLALPGMQAVALRCRGVLEEARGRREAAGECFQAALELHRTSDGALERGRTLLAYGAFLRRAGDLPRARRILDEAAVVCEACGSAYWHGQAEAERRVAGGRRRARPRAGARLGRLTPQEYRVGEFVHQGLSNRQIACLLRISLKTMETHMRHLYEKLEVTSREALRQCFAAHAPAGTPPSPGAVTAGPG